LTAEAINNRGEIIGWGYLNGRYAPVQLSPPRPPVLILPGIAGTFAYNENDLEGWLLTRGLHPAALQIDPLGHFYDDILQAWKTRAMCAAKTSSPPTTTGAWCPAHPTRSSTA
jgi:hypothetical protein